MVAIAQLVRASDCGSEGRGFEPHWPPQKDQSFLLRKLFLFPERVKKTFHQKPLLKAFQGKKSLVFALFLDHAKSN